MFGIIYALICTGAALVNAANNGISNAQGKQWAREQEAAGREMYGTYFDYRGVRRDIKTNEYRNVDFAIVENDGKDRCVRGLHGEVIRNLTEEEANRRKQVAIAEGRTAYLYRKYGNGIYNGSYHRDHGGDGFCEGTQFKDLKTGQIYVGRRFFVNDPALKRDGLFGGNTMCFYMNLDGLLVREADCEMFKRRRGELVPSRKNVANFIEEFNEKQLHGNGYKGWKDKMYHKDAFGKVSGKNQYAFKQYYCNDCQVSQDI